MIRENARKGRRFNAHDFAIVELDPGVRIFRRINQREGAQIDLNVVARLGVELVAERPIGRGRDAGDGQRHHKGNQDERPGREAETTENAVHEIRLAG